MKKLLLFFPFLISGCATSATKEAVKPNIDTLQRVTQELVSPPYLPEHNQIDTVQMAMLVFMLQPMDGAAAALPVGVS